MVSGISDEPTTVNAIGHAAAYVTAWRRGSGLMVQDFEEPISSGMSESSGVPQPLARGS